jgi:hypothetical protein
VKFLPGKPLCAGRNDPPGNTNTFFKAPQGEFGVWFDKPDGYDWLDFVRNSREDFSLD